MSLNNETLLLDVVIEASNPSTCKTDAGEWPVYSGLHRETNKNQNETNPRELHRMKCFLTEEGGPIVSTNGQTDKREILFPTLLQILSQSELGLAGSLAVPGLCLLLSSALPGQTNPSFLVWGLEGASWVPCTPGWIQLQCWGLETTRLFGTDVVPT